MNLDMINTLRRPYHEIKTFLYRAERFRYQTARRLITHRRNQPQYKNFLGYFLRLENLVERCLTTGENG